MVNSELELCVVAVNLLDICMICTCVDLHSLICFPILFLLC